MDRRDAAECPDLVTVRDEADQARYVVERVLENREAGTLLKHQAVLFRTSHHSGPLEIELTRRNIPFVKFGGLKFLDAAHVKDLLALLRFVENPRDRVAGFRVLQLLPGIGPTRRSACSTACGASHPITVLHEMPTPPRVLEAEWAGFVETMLALHVGGAGWPTEIATPATGTTRIWNACTKTPRRAAPICCSWSRSRLAIPRASASSPS